MGSLGQDEVVDDMIRNGANVNAAEKDGNTALHVAAFNGNEKNSEISRIVPSQ